MKKKEKSRRPNLEATDQEGHRRPKLKPVNKQKYKVKQVNVSDDEDEEIDLFNFDID